MIDAGLDVVSAGLGFILIAVMLKRHYWCSMLFALQAFLALQPPLFWFLERQSMAYFQLFHALYLIDILISIVCALLCWTKLRLCCWALLIQSLLQVLAKAAFISDRDFIPTSLYYAYAIVNVFTLALLIISIQRTPYAKRKSPTRWWRQPTSSSAASPSTTQALNSVGRVAMRDPAR